MPIVKPGIKRFSGSTNVLASLDFTTLAFRGVTPTAVRSTGVWVTDYQGNLQYVNPNELAINNSRVVAGKCYSTDTNGNALPNLSLLNEPAGTNKVQCWPTLAESLGATLTSGSAVVGKVYQLVTHTSIDWGTEGTLLSGSANTVGATYRVSIAFTFTAGDSAKEVINAIGTQATLASTSAIQGYTLSGGDASTTATIVEETGLDPQFNGRVIELYNPTGGAATLKPTGTTGNSGSTHIHSMFLYAKKLSGANNLTLQLTGPVGAVNAGASYALIKSENLTPGASTNQLEIIVGTGVTGRFTLPQLEESPVVTSPIFSQTEIGPYTRGASTVSITPNWTGRKQAYSGSYYGTQLTEVDGSGSWSFPQVNRITELNVAKKDATTTRSDKYFLVAQYPSTTVTFTITSSTTYTIKFIGANGVEYSKSGNSGPVDTAVQGLTAPVMVLMPEAIRSDTTLTYFYVNGNQLTGSIPSLTSNTALTNFNVSVNQLTGSIPSLTSNTALTNFNVSVNQLTGSIPSLTSNTALAYFYVASNQLTGSIPDLTFNTNLTTFYAYSNQLTGWSGGTVSNTLGAFQATNNLLTQSAVDAILAAFDAAGRDSGTRILSLGGTGNAAPSVAGLVSKANLTAKGWTVTTN